MKLMYDDQVLYVDNKTVESLTVFVIGIIDAARKASPDYDWCWNVCRIEFDDLTPSFAYGGSIEDVYTECPSGPSFIVFHPSNIAQPVKKKSRK